MSYVQLLLVIRNVVLSKNLQFMLGVINTRVSISPHKHFFCIFMPLLSGIVRERECFCARFVQ